MATMFSGQLLFVLLLGTILAMPISAALLHFYRRAVVRSMRTTARSLTAESQPLEPTLPSRHARAPMTAGALEAELREGPWRTARIYAFAGAAYTAVIVVGVARAEKLEFFPLRMAFLAAVYAWPMVLTTNLVAGTTPLTRRLVTGVYVAVFVIIASAGVARSPTFTAGQAALFWALTNLPPTLALAIVLARPVRAVGPLVLTFVVIAAVGANAALSVTNADERILRQVVVIGSALGIHATGLFIAVIALGAILFGVGGWVALRWIGARYQSRRISDQSITLDALWLLFAVADSIGLIAEHPAWFLTGPVAFVVFRVVARAGLAISSSPPGGDAGCRLLVLRVFALGRRGERLFSRVTTHWRYVGAVQLIAGPDLATATVEPHEFLDFVRGRLARRFIDGPATLSQRLTEMDLGPDRDGRYRVNDFFCFDNAWKMVVSLLARDSDVVLVDLRGFSRGNAGVTFELATLVDVVPLRRVVLAVDETTDQAFLDETIQQARGQMSATSPNRHPDQAHSSVVQLRTSDLRELPLLLTALSKAAA